MPWKQIWTWFYSCFYSRMNYLCLNKNMEKTWKKSYAKSSGENHDFSSHKSGISSCIFPIFHLTFKNWIFLKCISCAHLDCYLLTRGEQANKSLDTILSTESGLSIYEVAFEFPYSIFYARCNGSSVFWFQGAQDTWGLWVLMGFSRPLWSSRYASFLKGFCGSFSLH